jgi:predicted DCC family thiol-disulfide oxidoreductase YuxK
MVQVTIWFDGGCPLCVREIALMRKLDRRGAITFVDAVNVQSVCPIDKAELLARFHAAEDGKLLSGAAAFAAMWRAIPVLRPIGLLAKNPLVLWALEKLYLQFLRIRPRIQAAMKGNK